VAGPLAVELRKHHRHGTHLLNDTLMITRLKIIATNKHIAGAYHFISGQHYEGQRASRGLCRLQHTRKCFVCGKLHRPQRLASKQLADLSLLIITTGICNVFQRERYDFFFFWKRDSLKKLVDLALSDQDDPTTVRSTNDLESWVAGKEPGFLIKHFVCDINPSGLSNPEKREARQGAAISLRSLSELQDHLQHVQQTKPKDYH
jgi:hypothetical protein